MKKISKILQLLLFSLTVLFLAATILQVLAYQPPTGSFGTIATQTDSLRIQPLPSVLPNPFIRFPKNNVESIGNTPAKGFSNMGDSSSGISNNPKNPSTLTPGNPPY